MKRKERIEKALSEWTWNEEKKSYSSLTALKEQIELMNSLREQYCDKGDLSDKQICVAEKILKQNERFSRAWRLSRLHS